jgi:hypothetical protein
MRRTETGMSVGESIAGSPPLFSYTERREAAIADTPAATLHRKALAGRILIGRPHDP